MVNVAAKGFKTTLVLAALCLAGEALAQTPTPGETYPPGAIRVVPADLAKYWLVNNSSLEADAPNGGKNMDQPSCASVTYLIETDGKTSHIHLDKVVPPGDLGQVAISVVKALHYAPGPQNGARSPVLTRVVFPFNMPQAAPGNKEQTAAVEADKARRLALCEPDPPKVQKKP